MCTYTTTQAHAMHRVEDHIRVNKVIWCLNKKTNKKIQNLPIQYHRITALCQN